MFGRNDSFVCSIDLIRFFIYIEYLFGICPYDPFTIFNAKNCILFAVKGGFNEHI
jgi:hypothetical protein